MIIGCCFHKNCHTMRAITLIQYFFIVVHLLAHRSLDRCFNPILGHVDSLCILKATAKCGICGWIRTTRLDSDGDLLSNPRELFRHPVPSRKHGSLSYLKNSSHEFYLSFFVYCFWLPSSIL